MKVIEEGEFETREVGANSEYLKNNNLHAIPKHESQEDMWDSLITEACEKYWHPNEVIDYLNILRNNFTITRK